MAEEKAAAHGCLSIERGREGRWHLNNEIVCKALKHGLVLASRFLYSASYWPW